ncbi:MAG: hypothetical protein M3N19_00560 [Candidatus Eremiobacteraeota bacterium]|nr:hypothetical protein [Candidatus Eremiobacteraeota bacterium]
MPLKLGRDAMLGVVALALLIGLSLARSASQHPAEISVPSSYDTGPNGYRAFFELLGREGITPHRFVRDHHFLDARVGTLIVAQSATDVVASRDGGMSRNDILAMKEWTRRGGTLLVLAPPYGSEYDTLLGIPASRDADKPQHRAQPFLDAALTRGVAHVNGSFASYFAWDASAKMVPLLATHDGIVAMQYRYGKGTIVALTDTAVFSNARIGTADNARFGVQLARSFAGPVAFDEATHGYAQPQSLWDALPRPVGWGVWILAGALVLSIVGNLFPLAPPLAPEEADERDSAAYITSMAELLCHARAARKALTDAADSALRGVRRNLALAERTPVSKILARLQNIEQRRAVLELDRLGDLERPNDAELLRAGILSAQLRKDFP